MIVNKGTNRARIIKMNITTNQSTDLKTEIKNLFNLFSRYSLQNFHGGYTPFVVICGFLLMCIKIRISI